MKIIATLTLACSLIPAFAFFTYSATPSDEAAKNAFKQILAATDKNKDGKLSLAECQAMYKTGSKGKKNCTFWDADNDGTITEKEYVSKVGSILKKK
jgi:hypothetical protein